MTSGTPSGAGIWMNTPRPLDQPRMRLVCLPHAGAGASTYFSWAAALQPAGIEVRSVQYPGRENRLLEPLITSAETMTQRLADAWPTLSGGKRCAVFGHSMGAILAYELALELTRRGAANPPGRLFLSGRNPPPTPPKLPPIHDLPDAMFLHEVGARYGNLPAELLANPEMVALVTPILRADFKLVFDYRGSSDSRTEIPLTILAGTKDNWTTTAELAGWPAFTTSSCQVHWIEGDHFFHQKERATVTSVVRAALEADGLVPSKQDRRSLAFDAKGTF